MPTVYRFEDFESTAAGAVPTGFVPKTGCTFTVGSLYPVSRAKTLGSTTNANTDFVIDSSVTPQANCGVRIDQVVNLSGTGGTNNSMYAVGCRFDAATPTAGYLFYYSPSDGGLTLYKVSGSSFAVIASGTTGVLTQDAICHLYITAIGSTISGYVWANGSAMPASPAITATDTTFPAAGYPGFYLAFHGTGFTGPVGFDNYQFDDAGGAAATALTVSPATMAGPVGASATQFIVGSNGSAASGTVTPSAAGCTFTPASAVLAGTGTVAFTINAATAGSKAVTFASSIGLTSASATYNATAVATVPIDSAALLFSPFNWDVIPVGTFGVATKSIQTTCGNAYMRTRVTNTTSVILNFDTTPFAGMSAAKPIVRWSINSGPFQSKQLAAGMTAVQLASGLAIGSTHTVELVVGGFDEYGDRWGAVGTSPQNVVRLTAMILDVGGTASAPSFVQPNLMLCMGDSLTDGVFSAGIPSEPSGNGRASPFFLSSAFRSEYGSRGYASQGWQQAGTGTRPSFPNSWKYHSAGRLIDFTTPPTYVTVMHGTNGTTTAADVYNWLIDARAALGSASWIHMLVPPGGFAQAAIATGVANYQAAYPSDTRVALIDYSSRVPTTGMTGGGATQQTIDGVHLYEAWHGKIAAAAVDVMRLAMTPSGSGGGGSGGTFPTPAQVLSGVSFGPTNNLSGTVGLPTVSNVKQGITYGAGNALTGTYAAGPADPFDVLSDGTLTRGERFDKMAAVLLGKSAGQGTSAPSFRRLDDTGVAVSATLDADKNRTAVTLP